MVATALRAAWTDLALRHISIHASYESAGLNCLCGSLSVNQDFVSVSTSFLRWIWFLAFGRLESELAVTTVRKA